MGLDLMRFLREKGPKKAKKVDPPMPMPMPMAMPQSKAKTKALPFKKGK